MKDRLRCCATCRHFRVVRQAGRAVCLCTRLGYETKSKYVFRCWNPRERAPGAGRGPSPGSPPADAAGASSPSP